MADVIIEEDRSPDDHTPTLFPAASFVDRTAAGTARFSKSVLRLNGDSHVYRSDNPLVENTPCMIESSPSTEVACSNDAYGNQKIGTSVKNFHRITVHGSTTTLEWLKLRIDPRARAVASPTSLGPFSWRSVMP